MLEYSRKKKRIYATEAHDPFFGKKENGMTEMNALLTPAVSHVPHRRDVSFLFLITE